MQAIMPMTAASAIFLAIFPNPVPASVCGILRLPDLLLPKAAEQRKCTRTHKNTVGKFCPDRPPPASLFSSFHLLASLPFLLHLLYPPSLQWQLTFPTPSQNQQYSERVMVIGASLICTLICLPTQSIMASVGVEECAWSVTFCCLSCHLLVWHDVVGFWCFCNIRVGCRAAFWGGM